MTEAAAKEPTSPPALGATSATHIDESAQRAESSLR
jgi:hypothetical protein